MLEGLIRHLSRMRSVVPFLVLIMISCICCICKRALPDTIFIPQIESWNRLDLV